MARKKEHLIAVRGKKYNHLFTFVKYKSAIAFVKSLKKQGYKREDVMSITNFISDVKIRSETEIRGNLAYWEKICIKGINKKYREEAEYKSGMLKWVLGEDKK
jgi:hypothetical protein